MGRETHLGDRWRGSSRLLARPAARLSSAVTSYSASVRSRRWPGDSRSSGTSLARPAGSAVVAQDRGGRWKGTTVQGRRWRGMAFGPDNLLGAESLTCRSAWRNFFSCGLERDGTQLDRGTQQEAACRSRCGRAACWWKTRRGASCRRGRLPIVFSMSLPCPTSTSASARPGIGDPDAEGDHPGRRRCRHRLRHDRLQDHAPAADLPDNLAPLRSAIEARCHTVVRRARAIRAPGARCRARSTPPGGARAGVRRALPRRPEAGEDQPRSAPGHAGRGNHSSRSASTRQAPSGSCCTRARAAWQRDRHDVHRAGQAGRVRNSANLPDRTSPTLRKARATSATTCAPSAGRKVAAANREVMMSGDRGRKTVIAQELQSHVEAANCHHNYVQKERHFGEDVLRHAQGRGERAGRRAGHHPGAWARAATSCAARATGELRSCSHGAGRTMSRGEAKRRFTLDDHLAATEAGVPQGRGVIDETRRPTRHRRRDGGAAAISSRSCTAEAGRVVKG